MTATLSEIFFKAKGSWGWGREETPTPTLFRVIVLHNIRRHGIDPLPSHLSPDTITSWLSAALSHSPVFPLLCLFIFNLIIDSCICVCNVLSTKPAHTSLTDPHSFRPLLPPANSYLHPCLILCWYCSHSCCVFLDTSALSFAEDRMSHHRILLLSWLL